MVSEYGDHHLSVELIIEILLRLPVKSLLRYRCVCKKWYCLVQNSHFHEKHHHHNHHSARLLVLHYNYTTDKYSFALFPDETLASEPFIYHDVNDLQMPGNPSVFGPFNGILGLWVRDRLALWNPATREFKPLPVPNPNLPPDFSAYCYFFGFGLDPVTNYYKVVWIRYFWDDKDDNPYDPIVVVVYNLCTGSWRLFELDSSQCDFIQDSLCNTYTKGVYYWMTIRNGKIYKILTFDMSNEIFRNIKAPPDIPESLCSHLSMYIDSIALLLYEVNAIEKYFDIWIKKDEDCWTKQFTIGPFLDVARPLGFWKNNEFFVELKTSKLALYNPDTQEIKDLGPRGKDYCLIVLIYKESLVTAKGGNEGQEVGNASDMVQVQDLFTYPPIVICGCQTVEEIQSVINV
ncbi:F-box/kelch-repeat protein At3g23880-like [Cornus florida]|uniref:F-box/kelch-repeat protein At3g23880-like n=1 Tax=Cornus florida TaxID=4283 RepID=UPI002898F88E|nr:F-box/kelch-repeat protein At3g23880-like [Cornus florida]